MDRWLIEFYEDRRGEKPVEKYIDSLSPSRKANIYRVLNLVKEFGIELGQPYLKHLKDKIWEMKPGSSRILYFVHTGKKFVLLHGFTKKTRKTPLKEIRLAVKREKDYEQK